MDRRFLWGGDEENRKTSWVCWKEICQDRKERDLGVKNLELFNLALLLKWRWRMHVEQERDARCGGTI